MDDREEIARAIEGFAAAYNRGDASALLECYGEDLLKLRQGAPSETKPETARRVADVLASHTGVLSVTTDEILVSGDMAFARGSFHIVLTPKSGGETKTLDRRYVELWQRVNGAWRVTRTMDNV